MQRHRSRIFATVGVGGLVAVLAACSDSNAPLNPALSRAQADSLAMAVVADLGALPEGSTYDNFGGVPGSPANSPPGCTPTRSPSSPTNSDADPVPDSVRIDWAGCTFTTPRGETVTLSGTIDIIDPTPTTTDHAVKSVFTDFTRSSTGATGGTFSVQQNGTRMFVGSTSVLSHSETDFETVVTYPDGSTATHLRDWSSTFTADVAGSIAPRDRLPSGTWDVTGTSSWTRGERSWSLSVSTDPDLHYNADCTVAPKFDAGKITIHVTRNDQESTVTIEFTACGQYVVTRT